MNYNECEKDFVTLKHKVLDTLFFWVKCRFTSFFTIPFEVSAWLENEWYPYYQSIEFPINEGGMVKIIKEILLGKPIMSNTSEEINMKKDEGMI